MSGTNVVRHHFDLSHFAAELPDLQLHVGMTQFPVSRHDHDSLAQAARDNAVIGATAAPQRSLRITHFARCADEHIPRTADQTAETDLR